VELPTLGKAPSAYDERFVETMATAYLNQTPWTKLRLEAIYDLVGPQAGDRIVDLGCAAGAITHFLSSFGAETIGIDSEPLAIERARSLFPNLEFVEADATRLPFDDNTFDKAVAADFTEHLDDHAFREVLSEVHRVLRSGGTLSIYTPNPRHLIERLKKRNLVLAQNPTHIGLRDATQLKETLTAEGYTIERGNWVTSFIPLLGIIERAGGSRLELLRYRLCMRASAYPQTQTQNRRGH
jgi:SAM-dependent methyltransferase